MKALIISVNPRDCVHYRGFRYGGYPGNIYEDYISGLVLKRPLDELRTRFSRRVMGMRTHDWSKILNVNLTKRYSPWIYPWALSSLRPVENYFDANSNPDIICHTSSEGVMASHINREIFWLERALAAMRNGYDPEKYGFIRLLRLSSAGQDRFIVLDGNHRISALSALGVTEVRAKVSQFATVRRELAFVWPGFLSGKYRYRDCLTIFDRYFLDNNYPIPETGLDKVIYDEPGIFL